MKIALLFRSFGPYHLARLHAAREHNSVFALEYSSLDSDYDWDAREAKRSLGIVSIDERLKAKWVWPPSLVKSIAIELRKCAPDAVAIPGYSEVFALSALYACRRLGIPAILMSDTHAQTAKPRRLRTFAKKRLVSLFQSAFVAGSPHASYLMALGVPREKIAMGYDVIDNRHFEMSPAQARCIEPALWPRYFFCCTRLIEKKNISFLIEAFSRYRHMSAVCDWHLVIAGDGPLRQEIEEQRLKSRYAADIHLLGSKTYDELPKLYQAAGAFVLPSLSDEWGLVVNEAMAAGLPVLVSNRAGCARDLVQDGVNGFAFDPTKDDELAALMQMLSQSEKISAMGRESLRIIAGWNVRRFASGLAEAARMAIESRRLSVSHISAPLAAAPRQRTGKISMKVALVTGSLSRFGGGVTASVHALSSSLLRSDVDVRVIGLQDRAWESDRPEWIGIPTKCLRVVGPSTFGYSPHAFDSLRAADPDIAHSHGIWKHTSRVVVQWAMATRRPYVISPHGMLDGWAMKRAIWKKRIAAGLYEDGHLRGAACFHALCDAEADVIRALGFDAPICVIPNGVVLPSTDDSRVAPWRNYIPEDRRVMLFLGRLHPKKNLSALIEAWPSSASKAGWHLAIAGWDQGGHVDELRALVAKRNLGSGIHFLGPLFGREKSAALRRADAFVLPSLSEGLPVAVLEAWSYGLPVLQTDACNLREGFLQDAAIRISPAVDELAGDLRAFMNLPPETLAAIGRNGRRLTEQNFGWGGIAAQMREVYSWLLDGGDQPGCVRFNGRRSRHAA